MIQAVFNKWMRFSFQIIVVILWKLFKLSVLLFLASELFSGILYLVNKCLFIAMTIESNLFSLPKKSVHYVDPTTYGTRDVIYQARAPNGILAASEQDPLAYNRLPDWKRRTENEQVGEQFDGQLMNLKCDEKDSRPALISTYVNKRKRSDT